MIFLERFFEGFLMIQALDRCCYARRNLAVCLESNQGIELQFACVLYESGQSEKVHGESIVK